MPTRLLLLPEAFPNEEPTHEPLVTENMGYGYDPEVVCRFPHPNRSSTDLSLHAQWMFLQCPPWSVDFRTPAFCCGTEEEKSCCDWSTYVLNWLGGGHTGVGMGIFVGLLFVAAFAFFLVLCIIFQCCVVASWNRRDRQATLSMRSSIKRYLRVPSRKEDTSRERATIPASQSQRIIIP